MFAMTNVYSMNIVRHHSLIAFLLLLTPCNANIEEIWSQWGSLVRYLISLFLFIFGLHLLLYGHLATYALMKFYKQHGDPVNGDVLDCTPIKPDRYQITVLYTALVPKFKDSRRMFRNPDTSVPQRLMRRFDTSVAYQRGNVVTLLLLPGVPTSGLLVELVDHILAQHSHLRTILFLVPGFCLIGILLWMALATIQNQPYGYVVLVLSVGIMVLVSRIFVGGRWETEKKRRFLSAVVTKTVSPPATGAKDPLLPTSHDTLVVVPGYDVPMEYGHAKVVAQ